MTKTVLYDDLSEYFSEYEIPDWYDKAVNYLRGGADFGSFGLYLYNYIKHNPNLTKVINIGTARGHSAICAAKAIERFGDEGVVHTIDIIPPDEPRNWHVPKQSEDDPAIGKCMTMKDLISRFHSPSDDEVPIKFYTGDSNDVLRQIECSPELVFHDAMHTYQTVSTDINTVKHMSDKYPIQVFDDCYLFDYEWRYTPFSHDMWLLVDHIPKFREAIRKLRHFSISKSRYFGVNKAVKEELNRKEYNLAEFIMDNDHAPITVLRNRSS